MIVYTIRVLIKSRWKKCCYPAAKWTPNGNTGAKVPQDPDDDDAGAQPVGSGLGTQARVGEGRGVDGHEEKKEAPVNDENHMMCDCTRHCNKNRKEKATERMLTQTIERL